MSRIGNAEIKLPSGVSIDVKGTIVTVSGPKGTLSETLDKRIKVSVENGIVKLERANEDVKALHGLSRALVFNMVKGVSEGFFKILDINGVGYKASVQGEKLVMNLGYSHPIEFLPEKGIKFECPTVTSIKVIGISKQQVGQVAANIREARVVEPYHGYGIKYSDEKVIRKVGKTAGKGKK